ncbi:MAG: type II toxin-antitoxin system HicA family toxin [Candidatus Riflebacteria bacterium]|nr:type II toxin-antitoxin system HicA family toxin [Candidatus Riflebacteria bacterium]
MSKREKLIEKMKNNQLDWSINDIKALADFHGVEYRQNGTSHVIFIRKDGKTLPIPSHRPIKPIYIKKLIEFLEV